MKIGIDVSQLAYENTGVANYLENLSRNIIKTDSRNEYILFFSSLRKRIQNSKFKIQNYNSKVKIKEYRIPPTILDVLWNRLHIVPIEWLIGDVDIFITSDWTEPPVKQAKKATILYDLVVYRHPEETDRKIVQTQRRKLKWVKKESDVIFCISESTKKDAIRILEIPEDKIRVIYPGIQL
ncbi:MAG: glycosyltransferase [Patescibacteria group bacterium]|nr:glycosyltransferase [Patescibacteria group bacterium]MCL6096513.1 glycosyltransferase [Patescibacteria group bacterium]